MTPYTTTAATPPPVNEPDRATGRAVRFLLAHRLGRLLTTDPITREPHVSPVHYVADDAGGFLTLLPANGAHARAIRAGGESVLSVQARHGHAPDPLRVHDSSGTDRVWHVQAAVEARIIDTPEGIRHVLRRQIGAVIRDLPQHDKSDPLLRAPGSVIGELVGVRLNLLDVILREHVPVAAPAA